jgi:hypothetical protein
MKHQRAMATEDLIKINAELEPIAKAEWEINTAMRRIGLCNLGGKKPVWKWDKKQGKLIRGDGKGVDWYRYATYILKPKLIPRGVSRQHHPTAPRTDTRDPARTTIANA